MSDPTEATRRAMIARGEPEADAAASTGQRWTADQLTKDFEVLTFLAPFVVARRRSDKVLGSLEFRNSPRVYFNWQPDE